MTKLGDLNKKYPWLKIVVFGGIFLGSIIATVGVSASNNTKITSTQNRQTLSSYSEIAPVVTAETEDIEETEVVAEENSVEETEEEQAEKRRIQLEGKMLVALTFDDGPLPEVTERILATLKEKDAKATFFMMGMQVEKYPETAKKVAADGHEIGNHSWGHKNLTEISPEEVKEEITRTNEIIKKVAGVDVKYVRPPYGFFDQDVMDVVEQRLVTWSVDPRDWENMDAETTYNVAVGGAYDGAVILMHDIYQSTADALPRIIDDLRAAGYEFATIDEMSQMRDWVPGEGY